MTLDHIVVAGAGQAGYQVSASLRQEGFAGTITLVGDEPGVPYQRPPLSKAYLLGKVQTAALRFRPPEFFDEQRITRIQQRIAAIDRSQQRVLLSDGSKLPYDHLVLALGARNRVPPVPGTDLDGVQGIRTLADADQLSPRLARARRAVVIGAGFIGLEFAAVAAAKGLEVHVIELGQRPMARALSVPMSDMFTAAHRGWGVQLHFGQSLARIHGHDGHVTGVETASGQHIAADLVIYGIGVQPNSELAADAGLEVANGVKVDALLHTSDPAISALGDLAAFPSPYASGLIRLESVQNAVDQARALAARLVGKPMQPYAALPWFWTDQADMKLQIAGLSDGHDATYLLGNPQARQVSVLCYRHDRLIAVESVNRPLDHMAARKVLSRDLRPSIDEVSSPGFDLKAFEASTRAAG